MTREEAINVVRSIYQTDAEKEALAILIPELRESEDERIRKKLYNTVLVTPDDSEFFQNISKDAMLAYLEKQKESIRDATKMVEQKPLPGFDELSPEEKMNNPLYLEGFGIGMKVQKVLEQQKPVQTVEWNTHDKAIVSCIAYCLDGQFVTEAARKRCLEWFNKHRRDFLNQPKQEWREEDENALEYIHELISWGYSEKFMDAQTAHDMRKWVNEHLRPDTKL